MSPSSARAGFREATGIRRPPFRVRQRAEESVKVCRIRILRPARPHAADPSTFSSFPGQIQPYFARICHNLPYTHADLAQILNSDAFSAPDA